MTITQPQCSRPYACTVHFNKRRGCFPINHLHAVTESIQKTYHIRACCERNAYDTVRLSIVKIRPSANWKPAH